MVTRIELENPRTPDEMEDLLRSYAEDRETYPDEVVHRRIGIIKDLIEEYQMLYAFARYLDNTRTARLSPQSNQGPDGIVEIESRQEFAVQITVANQSRQEALTRELLSREQPAFASTEKRKDRRTDPVVEHGRALTTREARLRRHVQDVVTAIEKKIENFHEGTDTLLVGTRISVDDSGINYSWKHDLKVQVEGLDNIPYNRLYIANGDEVIPLIK